MTLKSAFRLTALACAVMGSQALLAEPAVVFDMGGKVILQALTHSGEVRNHGDAVLCQMRSRADA